MMATIPQTAYGEFIAQVKADRVKKVKIDLNRIEYVVATETGEETYITISESSTGNLPELLRSHGVEYTVKNPPADNWLGALIGVVLPSLVAVGAGALLLKYTEGGNGVMGVGKSKARVYGRGKTGIKFTDVAGVDEAKTRITRSCRFRPQK